MLVTLPFVLLLLDYWPLQRFEQEKSAREIRAEVNKRSTANKTKGKSSRKHTPGSSPGKTSRGVELQEKPAYDSNRWALIRPLLWEKMPLFALAALSSIVTFVVQQKAGMVKSIEAFPLGARMGNTIVSYIAYIRKTVWPNNLAVHYPHPGSWPFWQVLAGC
ncbi:MAG: hypothetical protein ACLQVJ_01735 [Syntrophobacteraceae bacterium]